MRLKQKLKSFFKTKDASETAVELLRMFILPFMREWNPQASVDDAVAAFFAVNDRKFYSGKATKPFKLPGRVFKSGARAIMRHGPNDILLGQQLLIAVDRIEQEIRIDVRIDGKDKTFLLTKQEFEYIKNSIEVREI